MHHFWISFFLFGQSLLFGFLGAVNLSEKKGIPIQRNLNNLSDGLLVGLLIFGLIPHLIHHWHGSFYLLFILLATPALTAIGLGHFLIEQLKTYIASGTICIFLFHSFVEGLAIGSSYNSLNFTIILASLLIHKSIESFCFTNQVKKLNPKTLFVNGFVIVNSLVVVLSFELGSFLKKSSHFLHDIETYCDLLTVMSLVFLVIFCSRTKHDDGCTHGWNLFSYTGLITAMGLLLIFQSH